MIPSKKSRTQPNRRIRPERREELELIRRYDILANRINAYTARTPLRYKVQASEEMKAVLSDLERRGLYHAGRGRFVTIPD